MCMSDGNCSPELCPTLRQAQPIIRRQPKNQTSAEKSDISRVDAWFLRQMKNQCQPQNQTQNQTQNHPFGEALTHKNVIKNQYWQAIHTKNQSGAS